MDYRFLNSGRQGVSFTSRARGSDRAFGLYDNGLVVDYGRELSQTEIEYIIREQKLLRNKEIQQELKDLEKEIERKAEEAVYKALEEAFK